MCPLRSSIDTESLSLTPHGVDTCFIYHPFNVKNYLIGHNKLGNKKNTHSTMLQHPANLWVKIQKPICTLRNFFNKKISHKSVTGQPKKHSTAPFCKFMGQNSKYPFVQKLRNFFNKKIGHKSVTGQPKNTQLSYTSLHLSANLWVKIQNTHIYRNSGTFSTKIQNVTYFKNDQNRS